ncbi:MAG: hypothetical protein A2Z14_00400 [Chloroflexi bacterium RBG_16_48_8]|nr:MAG: hypothetical protein A2Z14_00400 [Chloroflexi bacterium RBG_16_48_8]
MVKDAADLVFGQDSGQALGFFGVQGVNGAVQFLAQHLAIEEEEGAKGLILGGGGHVFVHRKMSEERPDFRRAHLIGMALVMEKDEAFDPIDIGLFGADGVMFEAEGVLHLIQKFFRCWLWVHRRFPSFDRFQFLFYTPGVNVPSNNPRKRTIGYIIRKFSVNATPEVS